MQDFKHTATLQGRSFHQPHLQMIRQRQRRGTFQHHSLQSEAKEFSPRLSDWPAPCPFQLTMPFRSPGWRARLLRYRH